MKFADKVLTTVGYVLVMISVGLVGTLGVKTLWGGNPAGSWLILAAVLLLMLGAHLHYCLIRDWRRDRA